ncbi:aminopeptidase N [Calidifontibacter sp. DB0510]|uniref:Aminopeptidase N n=1 Tax=Metallococcus carri TaxID=1656884 RepID=A0A967AZB9_9MICO|nr:aminopeptidase N [Metallococcus carri]NHN55881.1 aminopeptidase N [Metallococcus carri]NOP38431.1 aminopeptidase N [Calidifontibacter sp. DB2511S]
MPGTNLTQAEAIARSSLLQVESYDIDLDLTRDEATFATSSRIRFKAAEAADTFVDFVGDSVEEIVLNGESLDPATHFSDSRVSLPGLAQGANEVLIRATGRYTNSGEGLHRFVDPADNEVYLYSQFEVPDSRRMFPVFEQPDLKATFRFRVTAPAHWQVVSVQPTPEPVAAQGVWRSPGGDELPTATWSFEATPRLSSYITALVAGPYAVVRDSVTSGAGEVPLAIYCRKSLREYLDADNIFDCTKRGFAFFEQMFGTPYPFAKYDQLFTPEYNMGAMENAGCVTFNEIYIFRAAVSEVLVERRALTILHELAHMWFGDLVTMKWWDDLWLNESFAEWASTAAQAEATEWTEAWTTFTAIEKNGAYVADQLSSTHPIVADIPHLEAVESNFDGITYAKGASVLKQLVAYVGREPFVAGLRSYFAKHAWGNTTLADLLIELEATSGRDLQSWSTKWLQTAQVNTLRVELETDDEGVITAARLVQTAPEDYPTLRPHRLVIGFYEPRAAQWVRTERVEVDVDGAVTSLPGLVGLRRTPLVLVNDEDLTFAKVRLDEQSLAAVREHPHGLPSLPRALVLGALWDMTRDGELAASDYLTAALGLLRDERDPALLKILLLSVHTTSRRYVRPDRRDAAIAQVTATLREVALQAEAGSDTQLQVVQAFAGAAQEPDDVALIQGWLDGSQSLPGLDIDTEMRWTLLTSLVAAGVAGEPEITAELGRDATATGQERAARARAAIPTPEAKASAWQRLVHDTGVPNETINAIGQGFNRVHDRTLLEPYVAAYHAMLRSMWQARSFHIGESIAQLAYPAALADQSLLDATQGWLDANTDAPDGLRRIVAEHRDQLTRALRAQERDAGA